MTQGFDVYQKADVADPEQHGLNEWYAQIMLDRYRDDRNFVSSLAMPCLRRLHICLELARSKSYCCSDTQAGSNLAEFQGLNCRTARSSQYVQDQYLADSYFNQADTYVRMMTPKYVSAAEKNVHDISVALLQIWPDWYEAELKERKGMDPQTLKRFEELLARWHVAEQELDKARKRAYAEDPVLQKAINDIQRSRDLGQSISANAMPIVICECA